MQVFEWLENNGVQYHLVGIVDDTHATYTSNRPTGSADRTVITYASDGSITDSTGTSVFTPITNILAGYIYTYLNFPSTLAATIDGAAVVLEHIDALVPSDMRFRGLYHESTVGTYYEVYQVSQGVYNVFSTLTTDGSLLYKATVDTTTSV